jgi:hypothetical protein
MDISPGFHGQGIQLSPNDLSTPRPDAGQGLAQCESGLSLCGRLERADFLQVVMPLRHWDYLDRTLCGPGSLPGKAHCDSGLIGAGIDLVQVSHWHGRCRPELAATGVGPAQASLRRVAHCRDCDSWTGVVAHHIANTGVRVITFL